VKEKTASFRHHYLFKKKAHILQFRETAAVRSGALATAVDGHDRQKKS
jgi:hypothetical protein